jgi:hypothetical protein
MRDAARVVQHVYLEEASTGHAFSVVIGGEVKQGSVNSWDAWRCREASSLWALIMYGPVSTFGIPPYGSI